MWIWIISNQWLPIEILEQRSQTGHILPEAIFIWPNRCLKKTKQNKPPSNSTSISVYALVKNLCTYVQGNTEKDASCSIAKIVENWKQPNHPFIVELKNKRWYIHATDSILFSI